MKTFKQLNEILVDRGYKWRPDIVARHRKVHNPEKDVVDDQDWNRKGRNDLKHHSTLKTGHKIYYHEYKKKSGNVQRQYYVHNPETKHIDIKLIGDHVKHHKNGHMTMTPHIAARKGSTIKAHDLYHHLITKHKHIFQTHDHQSEGGKRLWQTLTKHHKDIAIHAHKKGKNINMHPKHDEDEIYTPHHKDRETRKTNLVAYKRVRSKR